MNNYHKNCVGNILGPTFNMTRHQIQLKCSDCPAQITLPLFPVNNGRWFPIPNQLTFAIQKAAYLRWKNKYFNHQPVS